MSMLDRYRRPGGFMQLLQLLETCGPAKQERFLEMIAAEDPSWAEMIRSKMLSINRIYNWPDDNLREILGTLQDLTLTVLLLTAPDSVKVRINATLSHSHKRKVDDLLQTTNPSPQEVATTHMKVIESARRLVQEGALKFERFDPDLCIDVDIEDKLTRRSREDVTMTGFALPFASPVEASPSAQTFSVVQPSHAAAVDAGDGDILIMKKKIAELTRENASLKYDLSILKGKLDQIKKIA